MRVVLGASMVHECLLNGGYTLHCKGLAAKEMGESSGMQARDHEH